MNRSATLAAFRDFNTDLDCHHERSERIIKLSRELTATCKRIIFLLQRGAQDLQSLPSSIREADPLFSKVKPLIVSLELELQGPQFWRYAKQISPGIQEYIEALAVRHYLEHHSLITYTRAKAIMSSGEAGREIHLPHSYFLLGLCDLGGELMRFCITSISASPDVAYVANICKFLRLCHADFEVFTPFVREISTKQDVTLQSLLKVEAATYNMALRGAEYGTFVARREDHEA